MRLILVLLLFQWPLVAARADIAVSDDVGRPVQLAGPARRIVSLAPHITELLFAAGAGDAVVGVTEFSDYPEAARAITRVGGGTGLDLEAILALQPDLVVAWQSGNPAGQVERLQSLGMTVFMSEPRQLMDVPDTLLRLGRLAGSEKVAQANADRFIRRYDQLQQRYAQRPVVSVFYQIWEQPLMTLNGEHLFSDVVRLCGGRNVFGDLPALAPQVDIEAVLAVDPEVIVVAADDNDSPLLAAWERWPSLSAVAHGHVYAVARERLVRHSPRILEGAEDLCVVLDGVREYISRLQGAPTPVDTPE
ncbi:MAG: cobalamin-binding protein [Gammaproteobacteria bacterium]|nr:MAG: cobalamin-binding protein [Gammaproteobacteria bacterium]